MGPVALVAPDFGARPHVGMASFCGGETKNDFFCRFALLFLSVVVSGSKNPFWVAAQTGKKTNERTEVPRLYYPDAENGSTRRLQNGHQASKTF